MKKITKKLLKYAMLSFNKDGRKIIAEKLHSNHFKTFMKLCILPYRYKGVYSNEYRFIRKSKQLLPIPYEFSNKYNMEDISFQYDDKYQLPYVLHKGKKLYFPSERQNDISFIYNQLKIEQDENSPHRYFTDNYQPEKNDIFVDVGCAEAMSTLEIIDNVSEAYVFEYENVWIRPLEATFADYRNKVHIIKKYAGDTIDETCTSIDEVFKNISGKNLFVKIDVEGAEMKVLNGAKHTFENNNVKCLCCTYHNDEDAEILGNWFKNNGFSFEFSKGVLFFEDNVNLNGELFRKALIRAKNY